ncbi:DUF1579 family protein [Caulobacter sp. UNC279MFTsu5.1]|uniref:DUF1579 family protein n=1 Tax=Caulobacter sp. UNC279MFTsu5.1 TaxID=1502775 RepID=UPI0008E51855|nr:DUF1579 family protein [Caulobacter sp. UNC279MFTsu5.1]SFJ16628.1 Protein of unknown function [Caulobacter sp. UNC279MFTsu5.1]
MRMGLKAALALAAMIGTAIATGVHAAPPDAEHAALARFAGHWTVKQSYWISPDKPPVVDQGKADLTMVLDGRHLRQELRIAAKDKPFQGLGYIGYDTAAKTFFSAWMDVNFTGLIIARGDYDAAAGRYTFVGETPDFDHPGRTIPLREVLTRQDDDHFTYAYYETRDGREAQAVRLEYTRAR